MTESKPISQNQRKPIIDILRGWTLLSVAVMNYSTIFGWNTHSKDYHSNSLSETLKTISETFFESKGWTLLAILFGYGFSVLLKNIYQSGQNKYYFFIKRMLWLFVFAFINSMFFGGDILNDYALMGIILLLFYNFKTKVIFILSLTILVFTPLLQSILGNYHLLFTPKYRDAFYMLYNNDTILGSIKANLYMRYVWMLRLSYSIILHLIQLACFLLGIVLQRSNFFENLDNNKKLLKKIILLSCIISIIIFLLQLAVEKNEWTFDEYYNLYYPGVLSIMTFTTSVICWLYFSGYFKNIFNYFRIIGKMTLTNYILQNMISFILFVCIRPNWDWTWYFVSGIIIYVIQIFFSNWWLKNYNYGYFEWLWRCLSYGKKFEFKKIK